MPLPSFISCVRLFRAQQLKSQICESRDALIEAHRQWRQRPIARRADYAERQTERLDPQQLNLDTSSPPNPGESNSPIMQISDFFFASRLDNWRAIQLYISLIDQPMWGVCDSGLCRGSLSYSCRPRHRAQFSGSGEILRPLPCWCHIWWTGDL